MNLLSQLLFHSFSQSVRKKCLYQKLCKLNYLRGNKRQIQIYESRILKYVAGHEMVPELNDKQPCFSQYHNSLQGYI